MEKDARIYVAGHRGMVGSAIVRELERQGYTNILTRTHKELDLTRQEAVDRFFAGEKPEYVFLAAAKVDTVFTVDVGRENRRHRLFVGSLLRCTHAHTHHECKAQH